MNNLAQRLEALERKVDRDPGVLIARTEEQVKEFREKYQKTKILKITIIHDNIGC